jgi:hypothetical protein
MHTAIGFIAKQVQQTVVLQPDSSAPGDSSSSSSSAGIGASGGIPVVHAAAAEALVPLQQRLLQLLDRMQYVGSARTGELAQLHEALLVSDSFAEAAMQLLCACTHVMYDEHAAAAAAAGAQQWQQQQLGGDLIHGMRPRGDSSADADASGSSSSSSNSSSNSRSSSACSTSFKRPVQARLLPISPVHERLQLLPAAWRQLYLQEVQKAATHGGMDGLLTDVQAAVRVLIGHTDRAHNAQEQQRRWQQEGLDLVANSAPAAAAAVAVPDVAAAAAASAPELAANYDLMTCPEQAVLLVIEWLQLLAA